MLADRYDLDFISQHLLEYGEWQPYPVISSRNAWSMLTESLRSALRSQGEGCLDFTWPTIPASLFLEFKRNGNRSHYEAVSFRRRHVLRDLVLAECVENEGRFLAQIVDGVWAICEETYWGLPAHINMQAAGTDLPDVDEPTVDLFAAETGALLAWSHYLMGENLDTVSPLVRPRIASEIQRRVLDPCLKRDDFWWMGFDPGRHGVNNWNPWVNSNWLTMVLLIDADPERRATAVEKILRSLDVFIDIYAEDGGCDEGPGYWGRAGASLFECLDQLYSASSGAINIFDQEKIKSMGRFIYRAHIGSDYYVNFADASAINHPTASLVYRFGEAIQDERMMAFGAWLAQGHTDQSGQDSMSRELPRLFALDGMQNYTPQQPLPRDAMFDGIQVMVARDRALDATGLMLAAKGGHNNESHNHNDVGNFVVYADGLPVIVDAGVETYTKKTFSAERYEIWTMQSAYHSLLPTLDGLMQLPGRAYAAKDVAYRVDDNKAQLTLDIADAYPESAGLESMQRTITLNRGSDISISDIVVLNQPVKQITLSLLTPCHVIVPSPGRVLFSATTFGKDRQSGEAELVYDPERFLLLVERVPITDSRLGGVWGDHLNRIVFSLRSPVAHDTWNWRITKNTG